MPRFVRAVDALVWWHEHTDAARDFGQGCIPPPEDDEMIDQSINNWDYPDWWYSWLDLDMLFVKRFTDKEQGVMSYYLIYVYKGEPGTFYRWREKDLFNAAMRKLWSLLPPEYRDGYIRLHYARPKKGEVSVAGIDPNKYYSTKQVAEVLGFHQNAVLSWIKDFNLKALRTPGGTFHYRILGADLIEFLTDDGGEKK